jgi:hypothetical protein
MVQSNPVSSPPEPKVTTARRLNRRAFVPVSAVIIRDVPAFATVRATLSGSRDRAPVRQAEEPAPGKSRQSH